MSNIITVLAFLSLFFSTSTFASTKLSAFVEKNLPHHKAPSASIVTPTYEEFQVELGKRSTEYFRLKYGMEKFEYVPQKHKLYRHHLDLLKIVYDGYKKTFPALVGEAPIPTLVAIWSNDHSASILDVLENKASQANVVLYRIPRNGAIKDVGDIKGTLAHELSHIYLRHSTRGNKERVKDFYITKPNLIGPPVNRDFELSRLASRWAHLASDDELSFEELNGLPLNMFVGANMASLFEMVLKAPEFSRFEECKSLISKYDYALAPVYQKYSRLYMDFNTFSASDLLEINQRTKAFSDLVYNCSSKAKIKMSLFDLIGKLVGMDLSEFSPDIIKDVPDPDFQKLVKLLEKYPPAIAILKLNLDIKKEMREIEQNLDVKHLKHYSTEVEADEFAAIVLLNMGLSPEDTFGNSLLNSIKRVSTITTQKLKQACTNSTSPYYEVPFGAASNNHPNSCWRHGHLRDIQKEWVNFNP